MIDVLKNFLGRGGALRGVSAGIILLASSSCRLFTYGEGCGPEVRYATGVAPTSDAADTLHVSVRVQVSESRGGPQGEFHTVFVIVDASPFPATLLPLPSLYGHVTTARLERRDGTLLLGMPLHIEPQSVGTIAIGSQAGVQGVAQQEFDSVRAALLTDGIVVSVGTDSTVPALQPTPPTALQESHDWQRGGCG